MKKWGCKKKPKPLKKSGGKMDKMISTSALYGNYLAHARTYSHKYIKREPNGHGGWIYTYPTDIGQISAMRKKTGGTLQPNSSIHNTSYERSRSPSGYRDTVIRNNDATGIRDISFAFDKDSDKLAKKFRQADKASQIYREGQIENDLDQKNNTKFQQTMNSIVQTAKNTISAGKNFITNLFSNAVTKNYTIKDAQGNTIASGSKPSSLSAVASDAINAGKKWLSGIITTKKSINVTETRGEMKHGDVENWW